MSPADNYAHVATRRNQAADFFTDKPPDIPDDDGNDSTKGATRDLTGAVQDTSHGFGHHSNDVADWVEKATIYYVNRDQGNAGLLGGVGAGGAQKEAAKGLSDVGVGSIMNSFLNPTGAITGAFEQALGGFGQAGGNIAGQMTNAGIQAGERASELGPTLAAKTAPAPAAPPAVPGGNAPAMVGESPPAGASSGASPTYTVSAMTPPTAAPSATAGSGSDYVHTELQDRNDTTVRPTGMAMGGVPTGLGALGGGGSHGSAVNPPTYRIITGDDDQNPATEPIPVIVDPGIAAPPASVSVPLRKST